MSQAPTRDFLALNDHRAADLLAIVERAQTLAACWCERRMPRGLDDRRIALIVDDGGWRNTTAFDLGIQAMGGTCVHASVTFDGREPVADLAAYLDNWVDAAVIRTPDLALLRQFACAARSPVINARTRSNHPCETLGDLSFLRHEWGSINDLRIAAVAPDDNISRSWAEAAAALPLTVVQIYPEPWHVRDPSRFSARFSTTTDLDALCDADVVITDCWPRNPDAEALLPYQITADVLRRLKPEAIFIPCPPVTRGQEVSEEAMHAPACRVVEAKAFLLHAQNALLEWIFAA
ncbi:MAG: ornithine carbamoyltransferase [Dehalococcoidia bacterium]